MIVIITEKIRNQRTNSVAVVASHRIDLDTFQNVILPSESPESLGAVFSTDLGEWVLPDTNRGKEK